MYETQISTAWHGGLWVCSWEPKTNCSNCLFFTVQGHMGHKIIPKLSNISWCCFWDCYERLAWVWHQACHKLRGRPSCASVFPSRELQFYLLNMESVCFDTSDRSTDGGSLARCLSSWQGCAALGRGAQALPTSCLIWRRPFSAFHSARVKHTHPSQPLPCFLPGYWAVFCSHFSPPTLSRQSGTALQ